ncbi:30S ribosomal protein S20 [Methylovorus sp. MP688]|uniref:30S ribosomal protein S20 n=1 Tax=Methylovorus sp. (strain MP688) TaxID=887061 RepID=UPI00059E0213|nr:30S ribosomal protein S20 [Methylovorus sp. MP688]
MANSSQAKKRARQAIVARNHNASLRSAYRTSLKKIRLAISTKDKSAALLSFQLNTKIIDRIADKGIYHKNKAARDKKRLSASIKALA